MDQGQGLLPCQAKQGFSEGVGAGQGAIEIDDEGEGVSARYPQRWGSYKAVSAWLEMISQGGKQ